MTDDATTDQVTVDAEEGATLIEQLRRRREAIGEDRTQDMDVPGYARRLVCRVRPVPWQEIRKISDKATKSRDEFAILYGHIDIIIRATVEVMYRGDDGEVKSLPGGPMGWDDQLAELFGVKATRARDVLRGIFNNDLAITSFQNELVEWMQDANADVDEEFQGE